MKNINEMVAIGGSCRWTRAGFTLIELIVVMAIIGIAATIAIPSFSGFMDSSSATSASNDLVSALNLARSEAVTRSVNVTVCKSANQSSCTSSGNWDQGWIVFTDIDADGTVDTGDELLRVYSGPGGGTTMNGSANVSDRFTYASTGYFAGDFDGTVTVNTGHRTILIATNRIGRVRTQ